MFIKINIFSIDGITNMGACLIEYKLINKEVENGFIENMANNLECSLP